jgi:hypothetical protein
MKINAISFRLIGLIFSIVCAVSCLAADPPATTKDNYNVTMNDGTVLVGAIQIKKVAFTASYGATDVSLADVVSLSGGFLTLNDGTKLKGGFSSGNLTIETAHGEMNVPFESIASVIKSSGIVTSAPDISISGEPPPSADWNDPKMLHLSLDAVIAHPDKYIGKTFRFIGGIGRTSVGDGKDAKVFQFVERNALGDRKEIIVLFGGFYDRASKSIDGKEKIRILANQANESFGGQGFTLIATVQEFSDTFQPYINLIDFRENGENGLQSTPAKPSAVVNPSETVPTTENKVSTATPQTPFDKLTAKVPNANLFANHTKEYAFSYDQVWGAVSSLIAAQKETVLQSDKNAGILTTAVTRHGLIGFPSYDRYCLLVEKVNDTSTKVTLKVLRYYMDFAGQHGPPNTLEPQKKEFANSKAEEFLDKVNTRLQTEK